MLTPTNEAIACVTAASVGAVGSCVIKWAYDTVRNAEKKELNDKLESKGIEMRTERF